VKRAGRTAVAIGIIAVLLAAGVSTNEISRQASAASVVVDASTTVTVTATSTFSFTPNVINEVPAGAAVTFDFVNGDTNGLTHTFTILACPNITIPTTGPYADNVSAFTGGAKCGTPLLNLVPAPKSSKSMTVTTPTKPQWYEFVCTEPGHFEQGMYGFIAFDSIVPANVTPLPGTPGAGLAVFIIVGTIVTLTVIAIVLGFVVGRREGSQHEMPPERLGYAEPGSPPARPKSPPNAPPPA